MNNETRNENQERLVARYTDQPSRMPSDLRTRIQAQWGGSPVLLYAMADMDASMRLARDWVALGQSHVAVARELPPAGDGDVYGIAVFPRAAVRRALEKPGLSSTTLLILGDELEAPLAVLRYTHRQDRAMGNLKFMLEEPRALRDGESDALYAEALSAPVRETQASVAGNQGAVVWRLLAYLRPYRARVALGMTGAALMTLVSLLPAFITGRLIDRVIRPFEGGRLDLAAASRIATLALGGIAAVYVLRELFTWVRMRTMSVLGEAVAQDLRDELYEHLQTLSLSFFATKQTGSLITRVTSDTDRIWDFIAFGVVEVSISLLSLTALAAVLLSLDWRLGLVMVVPVPVLLYAIYRHGQRMQDLFLRTWRKWSNLTDVLSDTIPGMRVVKAFHQEGQERKRFVRRNKEVVREFYRIHSAWTGFWPILMLSVHAAAITVWAFALPRIISGQPTLSAGTLISFVLYMTMFTQPIEVIGQMARMLNRATSSAHRIFEILDTEPQITDIEEPIRLEPVRGEVRFENVTFGYDGVRQVLKGVSFRVRPGEMIGLVGPSGGGKSTLVNLIARFYEATGGTILIDDVDIRRLETGHFRRQVGMVLQDPYLFHGTILDNIRYGMPEAKLSEVIAAAKAANAHDFVSRLPNGYDTVVGERGQTLSGGERQRVSIARAILHDPRILILDEATSAVDTETEAKIQEALDRLVKGRTVFAIAHRLSTLARADRILHVKDGRITDQQKGSGHILMPAASEAVN